MYLSLYFFLNAISLLVEGPLIDKSSKRPKSTPIEHSLKDIVLEMSLKISFLQSSRFLLITIIIK